MSHMCQMSRIYLWELKYSERMVELGAMAAYLHDIGNMHNRKYHGPTGAQYCIELED